MDSEKKTGREDAEGEERVHTHCVSVINSNTNLSI